MSALEYDVFLCFPGRSAGPFARTVASALARRGFRVFQDERTTSDAADARRLALIAEVPDFLVVDERVEHGETTSIEQPERTSGTPVEQAFGPAFRTEVERALATGRNVVRVAPGDGVFPAALPALERSEVVRFDAARVGQSVLRSWPITSRATAPWTTDG